MQTKNKLIVLLTILTTSALLPGCKKNPPLDPSAKVLFGGWRYVFNTGGLSGGGSQNPNGFNSDTWIEYTEKGKYQVYNKSERIDNDNFSVNPQGSSNDRPKIVYGKQSSQTFNVSGDTLYLFDTGSDGLDYVFVKR